MSAKDLVELLPESVLDGSEGDAVGGEDLDDPAALGEPAAPDAGGVGFEVTDLASVALLEGGADGKAAGVVAVRELLLEGVKAEVAGAQRSKPE